MTFILGCSFSKAIPCAPIVPLCLLSYIKAVSPAFTTKGGGVLGQNSSTPSLGPELAQSTHIPCDPRQTDAGALQQRTGVGRHDSPALSPPTAPFEALGNQISSLGEAFKAVFAVSSLGSCSCKGLSLSWRLKVQMGGEPSSCRGTETGRSSS